MVVPVMLPTRRATVTFVLIGVTVTIFLLQLASQQFLQGRDVLAELGAKENSAILAWQLWRFFTPALLHVSITHILFNMYALYVLGRGLEIYYGHKRFLVLYVIAAFTGNVVSFFLSRSASIGASTSIFGLVAAEGVFVIQNQMLYRNARARLLNVLFIVVLNLGLSLLPNIDLWGHLGGLLGGAAFSWLAGPIWKPTGNRPDVKLVDSRGSQPYGWLAIGIGVMFTFLAVLKFLFK